VVVLVAVSLFLHVAEALRGKEVCRVRERLATLVQERSITAIQARRARFYQIGVFLAYPMSASFAAADLVRRVHDLARPLRLLSIRVDPEPHGLAFDIDVGVMAASPQAARREFATFIARLQMLDGVVEASFTPGEKSGRGYRFSTAGRVELP
jgi:hypothetical protein